MAPLVEHRRRQPCHCLFEERYLLISNEYIDQVCANKKTLDLLLVLDTNPAWHIRRGQVAHKLSQEHEKGWIKKNIYYDL
jgi:hypothetical protein